MISVIIPVYNAAPYLRNCLNSILLQTFTDFELLIINDGSNDGSEIICEEFKIKDSRIRIIHKSNQGEYSARNCGIQESKGAYIVFIDADDYIPPTYLEKLYNAIIEKNSDLAICKCIEIKENQKVINNPVSTNHFSITKVQLIRGLFSSVEFMSSWGKIYKSDLIKNQIFIERSIGLDVEFNSRIYLRAKKIIYIPEGLYYWVEHSNSVSRTKFSQKNIDSLDCYLKAWQNMPSNIHIFRAFALQRLYKVILYNRYNCTQNLKKILRKKEKNIVKISLKEFLDNRFISLKMKIILMVFYFIPITYNLFRKVMGKISLKQ